MGTKEKSLTLSALLPPIKYLVTDKIPLNLQGSHLSSPSLLSLCSSERWSNHLIISLWPFHGLTPVCPYWGAQHWTQLFQLCLAKVQQRKDHLPWPAGNSLSDAAQDNICLPSCKGTLLAHAQLDVHQNHFWKAVFQLFGPQLPLVHAVVPPSVQDFVLPLPEVHKAPVRFLGWPFTTSSKPPNLSPAVQLVFNTPHWPLSPSLNAQTSFFNPVLQC